MSLIERAISKAQEEAAATAAGRAGRRQTDSALPGSSRRDAPDAVARVLLEVPRRIDAPQLRGTLEVFARGGFLSPPDQQRQKMAEYRHVKRRLLDDLATIQDGRAIMIASALPGEGKSFSAVNLALSLAREPDYAVLLVDGDVLKPNISRVLELTDKRGLLDAAADTETDVESLLVTTDIEGLSVLPAGTPNHNATELLASARMRQIVQQLLGAPNRLVVFDSLPLLVTTEARSLSALAGQVVLVVRAEVTTQQAVSQAIEVLGQSPNVKLLLNAVMRTKASEYLGYGYGYSYNYGDSSGEGDSKLREKKS